MFFKKAFKSYDWMPFFQNLVQPRSGSREPTKTDLTV